VALLGSAVSGIAVQRPSLWYDEAATAAAVRRSPLGLAHLVAHRDLVHALYYLVMHGWTSVFGMSPLALRVPSVVAAGLACFVVFRLALRLAGLPTAVASGVVTAFLPGLSWAGTEARSYAFLIVFGALASLQLVRALDEGRRRDWVVYAVVVVLGAVLFLYGFLIVVCHLVTLVWLRRPLRRFVWSVTAALVLLTPFALLASRQGEQIAWIDRVGIPSMLQEYAVKQYFLGSGVVGAPALAWAAALLLGVSTVVLAAVTIIEDRRDPRGAVLPALAVPLAVLPGLLLILASVLVSPTYTSRYALTGGAGVALLIGRGLVLVARRRTWTITLALTLVMALALPALVLQKTVDAKHGEDYRAAAAFAVRHGAEVLLFDDPGAMSLLAAYPERLSELAKPNALPPTTRSPDLFGTVTPVQDLSPSILQGRVALVSIGSPQDEPTREWLAGQGCVPQVPRYRDPRLSVVLFGCPVVPPHRGT
jgi:mannosyltransferase